MFLHFLYKLCMRSIKLNQTLTCPNCAESFDAEQWSFVRVTQNPELKDAALGGELNLFCCPHCSAFFYGENDFVYLDEQASLLIFVFSDKNQKDKRELLAKMQHDYEQLRNSVFKQLNLDFGPMCVFGLEELKEVVEKEQQRTDESEAIAAAAAALGLKVARLKPEWARERGFPLYTAAGTDETAASYADSARKVLKSGLKSPLLKHFADKMEEGGGADAPEVL